MSFRQQVSALMLGVAVSVVMPRFRLLAEHEIAEKSPGEIVTSVDHEVERRLGEGLAALGLDARIIGEEAAAHDAGLLHGVGEGLVWLIDPLDGTANYAAGRPPFGMMVALVDDGVPVEGWILDAMTGRICHAEKGRGATCDGMPVRARETGREFPVSALGTHFLSPELRIRVHREAERALDVRPVPRCAAESYPRLVLGQDDVALFQRILPWDHAAGALFVTEAGGCVTHWDGTAYRVGGAGKGILAAASRRMWDRAAEVLLSGQTGLLDQEERVA